MFHFSAAQFSRASTLTLDQRQDVELGLALMRILWRAGVETGAFTLEDVRRRGRCLLVASALVDVFHALGRVDASFHRTGINVRTYHGDAPVSSTTVGHPAAPRISHLWNAHMIVRLGELLFDPTFVQMLAPAGPVLHAAVFRHEDGGATHRVDGYGDVEVTACSSWTGNGRIYEARLFRLPRAVDIFTRGWRQRPDALLERRSALIARTLELIEHRRTLGTQKLFAPCALQTELRNDIPGANTWRPGC
ncbi:hypothetical protein [Aminobacter sp. AP02]|uniref:hypothetical protein n=1 Tax=Aminobacter sp. AP02 TaxID=2135737 RepID=UPI000D7AC438|nr:hypothetical protein [Aminobacter sp. AP02]PWK59693.1 hypothetical protein C8K44_14311 [Aminobacter sp. AP02]